jgi:hypothetical protein
MTEFDSMQLSRSLMRVMPPAVNSQLPLSQLSKQIAQRPITCLKPLQSDITAELHLYPPP